MLRACFVPRVVVRAVEAEDDKGGKVALGEPKLPNFAEELGKLPDGVLKVKTNPDGSFKSLIVKATVEIGGRTRWPERQAARPKEAKSNASGC